MIITWVLCVSIAILTFFLGYHVGYLNPDSKRSRKSKKKSKSIKIHPEEMKTIFESLCSKKHLWKHEEDFVYIVDDIVATCQIGRIVCNGMKFWIETIVEDGWRPIRICVLDLDTNKTLYCIFKTFKDFILNFEDNLSVIGSFAREEAHQYVDDILNKINQPDIDVLESLVLSGVIDKNKAKQVLEDVDKNIDKIKDDAKRAEVLAYRDMLVNIMEV